MDPVRIIPLGGLGEVGKNMTVYEYRGDAVVVDAGLAFPRDEHLGVDLVLPDFDYLRSVNVRAIVLTHGHEDHVGSLPYVLREIKVKQVLATRLTLGLIKSKLDEHGLGNSTELREVDPDDPPIEVGPFKLEFVRMAHSIPDNVAVVLDTPVGLIVHTSDYKLDHTPVDGMRTDVGKLAELGNRGVDLCLGDSTNAERPGFTQSERVVGEAFRQIIPLRKGRIFVTSFASNVHRVQQAIDVAIQTDRKVAIVGRSMRKNVNIARNLGYMDVPEGVIVRPQELEGLRPGQQMIVTTGSQGEPMSALTRIAYDDHPAVKVEPGDTVIISAKPVPGNELRVHDSINRLAKIGAEVLHQEIAPVHVSGHACEEEIRTVIGLLRPKALMPVHGEFRMLAAHAKLGREAGVPANAIVMAENGSVIELSREGVREGERIESGVTFVDGLSVGDLSDVALRDRRRLSEDGVLIIVATVNGDASAARPELIARGFPETGPVLEEMRDEAARVLHELLQNDTAEIKLHPGASARRGRPADLRPDAAAPADPARGGRGMSVLARRPAWADVIAEHAYDPVLAQRVIGQLAAAEVSGLALCRLLERWARGEAEPCTPGRREAALQRAAERVETALAGLEEPLARYLVELEADLAEGRSWYAQPTHAEFLDWQPVLQRAGVHASPARVAQVYLELAVLVRALEGLSSAAQWRSEVDPSSLWAGLFDLRENLLGRALEDLRALAA